MVIVTQKLLRGTELVHDFLCFIADCSPGTPRPLSHEHIEMFLMHPFKHTSCFQGTPLVGQFQECSLGFKQHITCMCFWYTICNINYKSHTRIQTYREWPQVRGSAWWTRSCCGVRGQTWHFRNLPPSLRCSSPYALLSSEPENKTHQNKRVILRKEVKK